MKLNAFVSLVGVAGLAAVASAQPALEIKPYTSGEIHLPIPDLGSVSHTIFVPDSGTILDFEDVWLEIDHTFVGDLVFTLTHGGVSCVFMDRPGVPAGLFGNSDDLAGTYVFVDLGPAFPEFAGGGVVPPGTYGSNPGDLGACFNTLDKFGDWTLTVADLAGGDIGVVHSWGFSVRNVPTPGAIAMLGLGGLLTARRRRN